MRPTTLLPLLAAIHIATALSFNTTSLPSTSTPFLSRGHRPGYIHGDPNSDHRLYPWLTPGGEMKKPDITSPRDTCKLRDDSDPGDKVVYCPMGYPFDMAGADKISVALYSGPDCKGFADHCAPRDEFCPSSNVQESEGKGTMIAHHFAEKGCLEFPESDVAQSIEKIAFHIMDWAQRPRHKPQPKMMNCKLTVFAENRCKGYPLLEMHNDDDMKCLDIPSYIAQPRSLLVKCKKRK